MSKRIRVHREGVFDYSIVWENHFSGLSEEIKSLKPAGSRICVVTDSRVGTLYQKAVFQELERTGLHVDVFVFPEGEASKNLNTVQDLYRFLIEHRYTRKDLLAALGGGVVGDLTGFAAATYLRGVDFIQIPTTLLAQVDSSVGGKTGVDFDQYKNMVGAFHQPRLVYMNMEVLKTLDADQFASGMGEVLKTALIRDGAFYEWIINHMEPIMDRTGAVLAKMIQKCCQIKSSVVESDPTEKGERAILNLGHTVGHAIEKLKDFQLLHGHCVALGTVAAAYISFRRGYLSTEEFYEIRDMNVGFDLPIFFDGLTAEEILRATKSDKKMANGQIRFILLKKIGQAVIDDAVTDAEIIEAVNFINGDLIDGE